MLSAFNLSFYAGKIKNILEPDISEDIWKENSSPFVLYQEELFFEYPVQCPSIYKVLFVKLGYLADLFISSLWGCLCDLISSLCLSIRVVSWIASFSISMISVFLSILYFTVK